MRREIFLLLFLLTGCQHSADDTLDNAQKNSVKITVDERTLMENTGCFDNFGEPTATAYIFENTSNVLAGFTNTYDDIDGVAPDPINIIAIQRQDGGYAYEVVFDKQGSFYVAVTCESDMDNPDTDDVIHFYERKHVRIGEINNVTTLSDFPNGHVNSTTECSGCHTLGDFYDISEVNHKYVIGACANCHG